LCSTFGYGLAVRRVRFVLYGVAAGAVLAACGATDDVGTTGARVTTSSEACAFTGSLAPEGVGPSVTLVTRGVGAQNACDAWVANPKYKGRLRPAYLPDGAPVCKYADHNDPPPQSVRTYELFGPGAGILCKALSSTPGASPSP
jgi:hypothetical protein